MRKTEYRRFAGLGSILAAAAILWGTPPAEAGDDRGIRQVQDDRGQSHPRSGSYYEQYRPDRHLGRHRTGGRHSLRYKSLVSPFSRYRDHRERGPHTYRGSLGLPPRPDRLTLRFFGGPGFSPYSRSPHPSQEARLERLQEEAREAPLPPPPPEIEDEMFQPNGQTDAAPPVVERRIRPQPVWPSEVRHNFGDFGDRAGPSAREVEQADYDRAWGRLARGDAESAQYAFASLALSRPDHGLPKAGFALSMAAQDDLAHAAWSMRRAFKVDAESIRNVPRTEAMEAQLKRLLQVFGPEGSTRVRPNDARFMVAALHYLLEDDAKALDALRDAIYGGDIDASTLKLLELLGRERGKGVRSRDDLRADAGSPLTADS